MSERSSPVVWTERGLKIRAAARGLAAVVMGLTLVTVNEYADDYRNHPRACYEDTLKPGETPQQAVSRLSHGAANSVNAAQELLMAYTDQTGSPVPAGAELTVCITPSHGIDTEMSSIQLPAAA